TVFTAIADVLMGAFVAAWSSGDLAAAHVPGESAIALPARLGLIALLVAASSCLYLAGMVLNDYFDRRRDAVERPARPIPSDRISPGAAAGLGAALLVCGVALAAAAGIGFGRWLPA